MNDTTLLLSKLQFFLSLGFFSLFLLIELGLAWVLLFFKLAAHMTGQPGWTAAYRFWVRVFALTVIMCLASSMPLLIQIGSLWPGLMDRVGEVAGPLLAGAVLTTFIFKSCFLGAMLFGQRRLSDRVHTVVVLMVAAGTTLSALWLIVLEGWMQAPRGALLVNGQYHVSDWQDIIFNPFSLPLTGLLLVSAALTVAFLMLGTGARQSAWHPLEEGERLSFRTGLVLAMAATVALAPVVAAYGHQVSQHQPPKAAATVGYWQSGSPPDLALLAWPDTAGNGNRSVLLWPGAGKFWLHKDENGLYFGLDQASGMAPPVGLTFWSFRLTVALGLVMALLAWASYWRLRKRGLDPTALPNWWRASLVCLTFSGWVLGVAGLVHVLSGLMPYAVNGTVTFTEIVGETNSEALSLGMAAYIAVYAFLLIGFLQLMNHIVRHGVVPVARRRRRA